MATGIGLGRNEAYWNRGPKPPAVKFHWRFRHSLDQWTSNCNKESVLITFKFTLKINFINSNKN